MKPEMKQTKHVLIDIGHPAHVHLFKHFIWHLENVGITYTVMSREKEITLKLLAEYRIPSTIGSRQQYSMLGYLFEFFQRTIKLLRLHTRFRFSHAVGTSVSIGFLSFFTFGRVISFNFSEDDDRTIPLQAILAYPFSTWIVNPKCIRFSKWKSKRILLESYHELAYLHPNNFTADPAILKKHKLSEKGYVIIRLTALNAHHDVGHTGISSEALSMIEDSIDGLVCLKSSEIGSGSNISPTDIHHLLKFAKLLISDSQTMSIEAAVLGTPSIRINTFKDKSSVLSELEYEYQLTHSFLPSQLSDAIKKIQSILENPESTDIYKRQQLLLLEHKQDLNEWMKTHIVS